MYSRFLGIVLLLPLKTGQLFVVIKSTKYICNNVNITTVVKRSSIYLLNYNLNKNFWKY